MPLISIVVASYVAGVLAGFAGWLPYVIGAAVLVALVALAALRDSSIALFAVFCVAGAVSAHGATLARERCIARISNPGSVVAMLERDASPGTFVAAELMPCGAPISLFVARGSAQAGSTIRATGVVVRSAKGVVIQQASIIVVSNASLWPRLRGRIGRAIDRVFAGDAPLVRALVIADKHELSPELRDRFTSAGLAHVLAISGFHIGIIAAIAELILRLIRFPAGARSGTAFGVVIIYIIMIGVPAAAVRAGVMLGARAISRRMQRPTSAWALLALGAAGPVMDPWLALDAGFQLSVLGVAALIAGARVTARFRLPARPRWRRALIVTVAMSTIATIVTAPLVAWIFGRVSLVAPLSAVVATPIVVLLQPILILALAFSSGPLSSFVAGAAHPLIVALERVASIAASVPGGSLTLSPTPLCAIIGGVASVSILVGCLSRRPGRPLVVAFACAGFLAWPPIVVGSGLTELHVIDVGQGDAIALRTPRGRWVLFDAGPAGWGSNAGTSTVIPYLARQGGTVAAFVLSHPHADHVGGAAAVIRATHPRLYYDPGYAAPSDLYRQSLQAALAEHSEWERVHPNDSLVVDGVVITFLAPDSAWAASLRDPNNASTIALVRAGDVRFLLVGDAERGEEDWLLEHEASAVHADVLKVGHHGSSTSSTGPFLDAVHPRLALVSVGAGNKYGHPSPETMRSIAEHGAQLLRTDQVGTIVVRTDGHSVSVEAGGDRWDVRASGGP